MLGQVACPVAKTLLMYSKGVAKNNAMTRAAPPKIRIILDFFFIIFLHFLKFFLNNFFHDFSREESEGGWLLV